MSLYSCTYTCTVVRTRVQLYVHVYSCTCTCTVVRTRVQFILTYVCLFNKSIYESFMNIFNVQGVPITWEFSDDFYVVFVPCCIFSWTELLLYSSLNILYGISLVWRFSKCGLPFLYLRNWRRYCEICTNFNLLIKSKLS